MNASDYKSQWTKGNNRGEGYGIGEDSDSVKEAVAREEWQVLDYNHEDGGECLCRNHAGQLVLVCDAHGAWAVDVEEAE